MKPEKNVRRLVAITTIALGLAFAAACKKDVAKAAMESDSNGYVCVNQHKFYTSRSVFADKCPQCGMIELSEVYGYICEIKPTNPNTPPGCGHVTLAPRAGRKGGGGVICEQCKRPLSMVKLPSGQELAAWGATQATKDQVTVK